MGIYVVLLGGGGGGEGVKKHREHDYAIQTNIGYANSKK